MEHATDRVESLIIRLQQGDSNAFEKIYEQYKVRALRTAYLMTGNQELAEDVLQETFVQCYLKINELKDARQFQSWMYRILTRLAWKLSKKNQKEIPTEEIAEICHHTDSCMVEEDYLRKEMAATIGTYLDQLPVKQKTTILLFYYSGCSIAEIARIMGCMEGTVKSRLFTAKRTLKKELEQVERPERKVLV